jgi:hypothetical protein
MICPIWDYYTYFKTPKEITIKQARTLTMEELGGKFYYNIFEKIALHTEGKSSETDKAPNLSFKQIVLNAIEENKEKIDLDTLGESLEIIVKNNVDFKSSKYRWTKNRLKEAIKIYQENL